MKRRTKLQRAVDKAGDAIAKAIVLVHLSGDETDIEYMIGLRKLCNVLIEQHYYEKGYRNERAKQQSSGTVGISASEHSAADAGGDSASILGKAGADSRTGVGADVGSSRLSASGRRDIAMGDGDSRAKGAKPKASGSKVAARTRRSDGKGTKS